MAAKITEVKVEYMKPGLDQFGRETPDPVPMAPPLGYNRQPSLTEKIRAMVRSEHVRLAAMQAGMETFEEADDFEVGDDLDPSTPYEEVFDPVDAAARQELRNAEFRAKYEERLQQLQPVKEPKDAKRSGDDEGRKGAPAGRRDGEDRVSDTEPGKDKAPGVSDGVRSGDKGTA